MCLGFKCPGGATLRTDASELVCRQMPCRGTRGSGFGSGVPSVGQNKKSTGGHPKCRIGAWSEIYRYLLYLIIEGVPAKWLQNQYTLQKGAHALHPFVLHGHCLIPPGSSVRIAKNIYNCCVFFVETVCRTGSTKRAGFRFHCQSSWRATNSDRISHHIINSQPSWYLIFRGPGGFEICCLSSCESFECLEGYSKKPHARDFNCQAGGEA